MRSYCEALQIEPSMAEAHESLGKLLARRDDQMKVRCILKRLSD